MNNERFIEEVFEIAFGDNAINRDYSKQEVINKLKDFSDTSLLVQELEERVDTSRKILGFIKDIPEKEVNKLEKTI